MHNYQAEKENIIQYLSLLQQNNEREWFKDNKEEYNEAMDDFHKIVLALSEGVKSFDSSLKDDFVKNYVFRIYRDVRFSKDKSPYKTHFGAHIANGGRKATGAGYYIHIEPGATMIGGGVYGPQKEILKAIRNEVYFNLSEFDGILQEKNYQKHFGGLEGSKLKTGPKDFPKDHEAIEYLKHKDFVAMRRFSNEEVLMESFVEEVLSGFKAMQPLNDFLNRAIKMAEEE